MNSKSRIALCLLYGILLITSEITIMRNQPVFALTGTVLTIDNIADVLSGDDITVTGTLTNATSGQGISNVTISFSGTGSSNLAEVMTDINGEFIAIGASPSSASEGWIVQAHFAGNASYTSADSDEETYDTMEQFAAPLGSSIIDLTDFGASIEFDDVATDGDLTVTNCDTPDSDRYLPLDKCLKMSTTATLTPNTFAHIQISFDGLTIPSGYSEENVDIFMIEPDDLDITESRDLVADTITGRTSDISRFILGVALHSDKPANAVRQEILVGDGREVSIRDSGNMDNVTATASLSQDVYYVGDDVTITVDDPEADLDPDAINTVLAGIASTTDSDGIIVEIGETGENTSIFEGIVELVQGPSSGNMLSANIGDNITAYYEGSYGRLSAIIDDVSEAGMVELSDYELDEGEIFTVITPVGAAIDLNFIDAQLGLNGKITVTISFSNAAFGGAGRPELKLIQRIEGDIPDYVDITTVPAGDIETTITGETTTEGQFFIASCAIPDIDCPRGGGGGGPFIPKGGVVLDSIAASVQEQPSDDPDGEEEEQSSNDEPQHRGGGGGRSSAAKQTPSGDDIESAIKVGSETVTVRFDSIESGGQVKVESENIANIEEIFHEITNDKKQGIVHMGDTSFTTAGSVFDVDASSVQFDGSVQVTIPYDESMAQNESNMRFLHYNEEQMEWEDVLVDIDIDENTVTGLLNSLSPIVAAEADDGTFGKTYFDMHPIRRIAADGSAITPKTTLEQLSLPVMIKNMQRAEQDYTLLVQIVDEDGVTQGISWKEGSLSRSQNTEVSTSWIPGGEGEYTVKIFIWDSIGTTPDPLSEVTVMSISVGS